MRIGFFSFLFGVSTANQPNSVPDVSSFDALISAVPVFPAKVKSLQCIEYPVPCGSFTTLVIPSSTRLEVFLENTPEIQYSVFASFLYIKYGFIISP